MLLYIWLLLLLLRTGYPWTENSWHFYSNTVKSDRRPKCNQTSKTWKHSDRTHRSHSFTLYLYILLQRYYTHRMRYYNDVESYWRVYKLRNENRKITKICFTHSDTCIVWDNVFTKKKNTNVHKNIISFWNIIYLWSYIIRYENLFTILCNFYKLYLFFRCISIKIKLLKLISFQKCVKRSIKSIDRSWDKFWLLASFRYVSCHLYSVTSIVRYNNQCAFKERRSQRKPLRCAVSPRVRPAVYSYATPT